MLDYVFVADKLREFGRWLQEVEEGIRYEDAYETEELGQLEGDILEGLMQLREQCNALCSMIEESERMTKYMEQNFLVLEGHE